MPSPRCFPPPWTFEEHNDACFIVKDATGQALGYFYFEGRARPGDRLLEFEGGRFWQWPRPPRMMFYTLSKHP